MSALEDMASAIELALMDEPVAEVLKILVGASIAITLKVVHDQGVAVTGDIEIESGDYVVVIRKKERLTT